MKKTPKNNSENIPKNPFQRDPCGGQKVANKLIILHFFDVPPVGVPWAPHGCQKTLMGTKIKQKLHPKNTNMTPQLCKSNPQHIKTEKHKHGKVLNKYPSTNQAVRTRWREGLKQVDINFVPNVYPRAYMNILYDTESR